MKALNIFQLFLRTCIIGFMCFDFYAYHNNPFVVMGFAIAAGLSVFVYSILNMIYEEKENGRRLIGTLAGMIFDIGTGIVFCYIVFNNLKANYF